MQIGPVGGWVRSSVAGWMAKFWGQSNLAIETYPVYGPLNYVAGVSLRPNRMAKKWAKLKIANANGQWSVTCSFGHQSPSRVPYKCVLAICSHKGFGGGNVFPFIFPLHFLQVLFFYFVLCSGGKCVMAFGFCALPMASCT